MMQETNQSIIDDNSEHVALLIKGSKIPQITCFLMLWLWSNLMQVWMFMALAIRVPDSWECNQTSHEKTGMCPINQPAPEGKACIHVPRREKNERSILSMYSLSLCNVVYGMTDWARMSWYVMQLYNWWGKGRAVASIYILIFFHCVVQDTSDVMQRRV